MKHYLKMNMRQRYRSTRYVIWRGEEMKTQLLCWTNPTVILNKPSYSTITYTTLVSELYKTTLKKKERRDVTGWHFSSPRSIYDGGVWRGVFFVHFTWTSIGHRISVQVSWTSDFVSVGRLWSDPVGMTLVGRLGTNTFIYDKIRWLKPQPNNTS